MYAVDFNRPWNYSRVSGPRSIFGLGESISLEDVDGNSTVRQ